MKKQLMIVGIIVILLTVGLSGCNNSINKNYDSRFVGTWKYQSITMTLSSDGTCTHGNINGTWEIKDNKLVFAYNNWINTELFDYYFSENNTILDLKIEGNNNYIEYIKQ